MEIMSTIVWFVNRNDIIGAWCFQVLQCANNAGVDSGLVLWSNNVSNPIRADYYFKTPHDISKIL